MDGNFDIFLTCLPRDVTENVIRNLFQTVGNVLRVKIIEDKKNERNKLCFVGFGTMDEAMEAVRLADQSIAFGDPIKACISKKSLDSYDSQQKPTRPNNDFRQTGFNVNPNQSSNFSDNTRSSCNDGPCSPRTPLSNVGRGRGLTIKRDSAISPSFVSKSIKLMDIKLKIRELIDVEIIDLSNIECIFARPLKHTENSKVEVTDILLKINSCTQNLKAVDSPKIGDCYLGKWDDGMYYRAELLECIKDGTFKVSFVDEGTSGDIVMDIKHIPEGPLQQYPKQFIKISLGCKNSDDLRNFIIEESDGKKVSLFWLGDFQFGIPLINLFLNDDEIVEKYIQLTKDNVRDCFSMKFKDMPNHTPETDCSRVTFVQSMYKSQNDFSVQIKEPTLVSCEKRIPPILPVPGDICIYEKRNGVNNVTYSRCVVKRRQLFSFDILLFDSGENLNNVSLDCLYAAEESHKLTRPFSIICELDKSLGYNEDTFQKIMLDENKKFTIVSYKGNNRYLVTVSLVKKCVSHYPEPMLTKFIGQSCKIVVTHVISPTNFFLQIDTSEYLQILNDIHEKINISYRAARFTSLESLKLGQAVVAPFSVDGGVAENFRATIVEKRIKCPQVHVFYIDYGNDGWVDLAQLLDVDDDLASRPALALNCSLNVDIRPDTADQALDLFSKFVGFINDDFSDLVMQVTDESDDKLVVDIISAIRGSVLMTLHKSGTCFMKDTGKQVSVKPVCNGDMKRASSSTILQDYEEFSLSADDYSQDFASLLKKVGELEQRLSFLERRAGP